MADEKKVYVLSMEMWTEDQITGVSIRAVYLDGARANADAKSQSEGFARRLGASPMVVHLGSETRYWYTEVPGHEVWVFSVKETRLVE